MKYAHVLRAVYGTPWAITRPTFTLILDLLDYRAAGGVLTQDEIEGRLVAASNGPRRGGQRIDTVAVIPVYGVLSGRQNLLSETSGGSSMEGLARNFRMAMADPDVAAIAFDIDSPGGQVDGVPEFVSEIMAARGAKPIVAVANTLAASAAYWIAAACDELICTPSGQVGSIGVITAHLDDSQARAAAGMARTLVAVPPGKADGWDGDPISAEGLAELQAKADQFYGMFTAGVAKGRGVSVAHVKTDYGGGRMLLAKPALQAGMIDRVATLDETIARLQAGKVKPRAPEIPAAGAIAADEGVLATGGYLPPYALATEAVIDATWHAGPLAPHHGETDDGPWNGPAEEAKVPNSKGAGTFARMYAWRDDARDPDTKAAYRYLHHRWQGGAVGPASTRACSAGCATLNGGRGGPGVPDADRAGVHAHLAAHMKDAGMVVPPLHGVGALATPDHITPTQDGAWDEATEVAKLAPDAGEETLEQMYAWCDEAGDPADRASYRLAHHFVIGDQPAAASVEGCEAAIAALDAGTSGVAEADRADVHDHLMAHLLYDAGEDSDDDTTEGALAAVAPYATRLELALAEARDLAAQTQRRADMRAQVGRHLSAGNREHLAGIGVQLAAVGAALVALAEPSTPAPTVSQEARSILTAVRRDLVRALTDKETAP